MLIDSSDLGPSGSNIALDLLRGKMYWGSVGTRRLFRANLDGSHLETLMEGLEDGSHIAVALDAAAGQLYWSLGSERNTPGAPGRIHRMNLDGTGLETLYEIPGQQGAPTGLALSADGETLYWSQANVPNGRYTEPIVQSGGVYTLSLTSPTPLTSTLVFTDGAQIASLFLDRQTRSLYVVEDIWQPVAGGFEHHGAIWRMRPDGTEAVRVIRDLDGPNGLGVGIVPGEPVTTDLSADLSLAKQSTPSAAGPGDDVTYTLEIANHGPFVAPDVVLSDTLPAGVTFASASDGCLHDQGSIVCTLGNVGVEATQQVSVVVTVDAGTGGRLTNQAVVTSTLDDPDPTDNAARIATYVGGPLPPPPGPSKELLLPPRWGSCIDRAELDGTDHRSLFCDLNGVYGLAADPYSGHIYWGQRNQIRRAERDGSNAEILVRDAEVDCGKWPTHIALDLHDGKMYWISYIQCGFSVQAPPIKRANLDGTEVETLPLGPSWKTGLALDLEGWVYWSDTSWDSIRRARVDGSGAEVLVPGLYHPQGLALDLDNRQMYWIVGRADGPGGHIQRADLDGGNVETVLTFAETSSGDWSITLDVDAGKMYWA
jgi:uncharacterized repeat protein (TIGR01451 family)